MGDQEGACTVVDRSGKNHPPRVRACHHRRCTGDEFVGSTDWGRVVAAAAEGETARGDESSGKHEGLLGE